VTALLPRWDVSDVFPGLGSRELADAHERVGADLTRLVALYDENGVGDVAPHAPSAEEIAAFEAVLSETNDVTTRYITLRAYAFSHVATDSRDAAGQALLSELMARSATLSQLSARFTAWVAALGADALVSASPMADDHRHPLQQAERRARHQMGPDQEELYAELTVTGANAWQRLHADVTSQLEATVALPYGTASRLPMPGVRELASNPDPAVRRAAYDAEMATWPTVAVPLAAALNAIKGEANTVNARRGWKDPLDPVLFINAVDRPTFDALQQAVTDALPDFRGWLRTKARLHGHSGPLPWWDLFAPLPFAPAEVTWTEGVAAVTKAFGHYAPSLQALAERAVTERWIDAEPRTGKEAGAFCASLQDDRSLVLLNWSGTFDSVQTLAHELGHAYHNVQLATRTPLQKQLPMALAETASIFCETLMVEAGLQAATGVERLALLDTDLVGATQVVVDIRSRFLFETEVFARRRSRGLSVGELCDLMLEAQASAYGDGLDLDTRHPWMWAVKGHYYSRHFYNWPYTYGLLFGLGLYARYLEDPQRFRSSYDELLSSTGLDTAAGLAARFGIDVRDVAFWTASLDMLRTRMAAYEELATAVASP